MNKVDIKIKGYDKHKVIGFKIFVLYLIWHCGLLFTEFKII